jgi:hypothetical protein
MTGTTATPRWNVKEPSRLDSIGTRIRLGMFERFMSEFRPAENDTVLDIGVTSDERFESANYFEQFYPFKNRITGLGLEDASDLERRFPGFRFVKGSATKIPFADGSFDYVHSGAVIEHVGNYTNQCMMIVECCRVARRGVFVTTPYRYFPIELHTWLPLLHWMPKRWHRKILEVTGLSFWAREENLNLMTRLELERAASALEWQTRVETWRLFGWPSNLLLIGRRHQAS